MPEVGNKTNVVSKQGKVTVVETTSGQVIAENLQRKGLLVINEGSGSVWLALGTGSAVAKEGIFLVTGGSSWSGTISGIVWTGAVQAISETAKSPVLTFVEV